MLLDNEVSLLILMGILIPTSSFGLQYFFSRVAGTHGYFVKHTTTFFANWLLVPFTVIALLTSKIRYIFIFIPLGIIVSYIAHRIWAKSHYHKKTALHFFTPDYRKLSNAGITHLLYSGLQIVLVTVFIFTAPITPLVNLGTLVLLFFAFTLLFSSYSMHKKVLPSDLVIVTTLLTLCIAKLYLQIPYTAPF